MNYDLQALDAALAKRIQEKKLPGVTVAIRGPEGVIFEKGYGYADEQRTRPINEHTIMGVASMSKSTVTLALCILAAEGRFSFSDPVTKYFPTFELKGSPRDAVTVHHLATHTAGSADHGAEVLNMRGTPQRAGHVGQTVARIEGAHAVG